MNKPGPLLFTILSLLAIMTAPSGSIMALQQDAEPAPVSKTPQVADIPDDIKAFVATVRKSVESGSLQSLSSTFFHQASGSIGDYAWNVDGRIGYGKGIAGKDIPAIH